ncbi:MAG: flagellar basal body L-ring protein FlgH [Synergistaceae bacterium]|jgi:flagellar L-ring protein precursor FlgH|nr:flagellar basal body L-ring protein FlgH [Synergistaceae bacterium]
MSVSEKFIRPMAVAAVAAGVLFFAFPAGAVSLWNDRNNWVADQRPSRVGDIVTVVVDERTDTKDEAVTDLKKSSSNSVSNGTGILSFIRQMGLTSTNDAKGDSSIERNHYGRTTISCVVTDVLPNGNLVIEGTRDVQTSEETLQLQLVGVIRPQDVASNNQIRSNLIANAELGIKGKGALTRTQKAGILTQLLQAIF